MSFNHLNICILYFKYGAVEYTRRTAYDESVSALCAPSSFAMSGVTGKENIFIGYIELELQLGEVDRARNIYVKYVETMPRNCSAWKAFASLEASVGEVARAR